MTSTPPAAPVATAGNPNRVKVMHISDTHGCHDQIEQRFGPIPADTDIIVHTGDLSNDGRPAELAAFNAWCAQLKQRMPHLEIVVIAGNHCVQEPARLYAQGALRDPLCLLDGSYLQHYMPAVKVLGAAEEYRTRGHGVRIWGAGWVPWWAPARPGHRPASYGGSKTVDQAIYEALVLRGAPQAEAALHRENYYDCIPEGVDLLLSHCPPQGILDCLGGGGESWGASKHLLAALMRTDKRPPKVVCWGHVHENRGTWSRVPVAGGHEQAQPQDAGSKAVMAQQQVAKQSQPATHWYGGCTYMYEGQPLFTHRPPAGLQCQVLSNAAILNHGGIDRAPSQITGRPHYFIGVAAGDGEGFNWCVEPPQGPVFFPPLSGHFR